MTFVPSVDDGQTPAAQRHRWAATYGGPIAGQRVADVGCWTGELLRVLEPLHPTKLVGVDVDGPWLEIAQKLNRSTELVAVPRLTEIPSQLRAKFDRVFFLETLEHLQRGSEASVLASVSSMLVSGGQLIMSVPVAGLGALSDPAWYLVGHRHYRRRTLTRLFEEVGMEVVDCMYSGNIWTSVDTLLLYLNKHILQRPYSSPTGLTRKTNTGLNSTRGLGSSSVWFRGRV